MRWNSFVTSGLVGSGLNVIFLKLKRPDPDSPLNLDNKVVGQVIFILKTCLPVEYENNTFAKK